jgi:hypothetical protein
MRTRAFLLAVSLLCGLVSVLPSARATVEAGTLDGVVLVNVALTGESTSTCGATCSGCTRTGTVQAINLVASQSTLLACRLDITTNTTLRGTLGGAGTGTTTVVGSYDFAGTGAVEVTSPDASYEFTCNPSAAGAVSYGRAGGNLIFKLVSSSTTTFVGTAATAPISSVAVKMPFYVAWVGDTARGLTPGGRVALDFNYGTPPNFSSPDFFDDNSYVEVTAALTPLLSSSTNPTTCGGSGTLTALLHVHVEHYPF